MLVDFDQLQEQRRNAGAAPEPQRQVADLTDADHARQARRVLGLFRGDRRSIAEIATLEGIDVAAARRLLDEALRAEGRPGLAWLEAELAARRTHAAIVRRQASEVRT